MPSLIENSNEVMKEQDEEVEAVPTGKDCDLSYDLDLPIVTLAHFMLTLSLTFPVQVLH